MSGYLIHNLQASITLGLLMSVVVFFFVFLAAGKKDAITQVCVRLFYSLHIQQFMRNHWKGQQTVAEKPFPDVGILNPDISCAFLSHHLVNSCRLAKNCLAAWSMGSKESGLIPLISFTSLLTHSFYIFLFAIFQECTRGRVDKSPDYKAQGTGFEPHPRSQISLCKASIYNLVLSTQVNKLGTKLLERSSTCSW